MGSVEPTHGVLTQVELLGIDPSGQLLAHALAVGLGLAVLVAVFLPVSGSQFNPAVTLVAWGTGAMPRRLVVPHLVAQLAGAVVGVVVANLTYGAPAVEVSTNVRDGVLGAEALATFSLVLAIFALVAAVAGLYFYLRVIVLMYFQEPVVAEAPGTLQAPPEPSATAATVLGIAAAITIVFGLIPWPLLNVVRDALPLPF